VVRTQGEPLALAESVLRKIREVNSEIPVSFTTMDARLAQTIPHRGSAAFCSVFFAGLAVLLAMAGVYGVMSYRSASESPRSASAWRTPHQYRAHGARPSEPSQ